MSADNNAGIQMRAMAQCIENEANPEQLPGTANPAMNPTVELHRTKEEAIGANTAPLSSIGMYQTCATLEQEI